MINITSSSSWNDFVGFTCLYYRTGFHANTDYSRKIEILRWYLVNDLQRSTNTLWWRIYSSNIPKIQWKLFKHWSMLWWIQIFISIVALVDKLAFCVFPLLVMSTWIDDLILTNFTKSTLFSAIVFQNNYIFKSYLFLSKV